ncbi:hypothetical protein [Pseudooceanicola nitratireducens]|uniref:hypothetical protein n=1 Tax=Pseudooceanicola nitratireducens TaxID=517719 RepID=UPI003C7DD49C
MAGISERLRRLFRPDPDDIIPGDPLFYWSTVKKVASNDLTKIIGIVPVVGYLILFNDSILDKIQFNTITGTTGDEASPFLIGGLTKLRMTFFGSLSVTMSFLIYQLRRPKELDTATDDFSFAERVRESYSVVEMQALERDVMDAKWQKRMWLFWFPPQVARKRERRTQKAQGNRRSHFLRTFGDHIDQASREWWIGRMNSRPISRYAAMILGCLGYLLLVIPTIDIAQAVIADILSEMLSVMRN